MAFPDLLACLLNLIAYRCPFAKRNCQKPIKETCLPDARDKKKKEISAPEVFLISVLWKTILNLTQFSVYVGSEMHGTFGPREPADAALCDVIFQHSILRFPKKTELSLL